MRGGLNERLLAWARARGCEVAWGPASVLRVVRGDMERRAAAGGIDTAFLSAYANFSYPARPRDGFVVVAAVPRPAHRVTFELPEGPLEALLPPTYFHYRDVSDQVRADLGAGALAGFRVEPTSVPLKTLAARLGLIRYGRNNLAYARGMGSYLQLVGCLTDAPLALADGWEPAEPRLLDQCARCEACRRRCPSGAITGERIPVWAGRCLTGANEAEGEWPGWVGPSMHHALIGCLECQRVCPANPDLPVADSGVRFSADETRLLLTAPDAMERRPSIARKYEQLGQAYHGAVFGRNLRALVNARRAGGTAPGATAGDGHAG